MGSRIERLTPSQEAQLSGWVQAWIRAALSTQPVDFEAATRAALRAYQLAGLERPTTTMQVESPQAANVGGVLMQKNMYRLSHRKKHFCVRAVVHDCLSSAVEGSINTLVDPRESARIRNLVSADVGRSLGSFLRSTRDLTAGSGPLTVQEERNGVQNFDHIEQTCIFVAWATFFAHICELAFDSEISEKLALAASLVESSGWVWWDQDILAISNRPCVLNMDAAGRLHCENGPSLAYRDGWQLYHWHGVPIPRLVAERPQEITLDMIRERTNVEVRRVMIERFGYSRYIKEGQLRLVDSRHDDHWLTGLRSAKLWRDEVTRTTFLDMRNSTPEPDGSFRRYILSIDPRAYSWRAGEDCLAAMASTWRRASDNSPVFDRPEDYRPLLES